MSKISCEVIEDLLPLYVDDVCSEQSKALVEEHLSTCESCQNMYHDMQEKLPEVVLTNENSEKKEEGYFIEGIKHKITGRQIIIAGIAVLIMLIFSVLKPMIGFDVDLRSIPIFDKRISVDDVKVTDLCQLEDGRIFYTLNYKKGATTLTYPRISVPGKDGQSTVPATGSTYREGWIENEASYSIWEKIFDSANAQDKCSFTTAFPGTLVSETPPEDANISSTGKTVIKRFTAIYYVGKGEKRKLIWEEGDSIPNAPESVERKVKKEEDRQLAYENSDDTQDDDRDIQKSALVIQDDQ